MKKTIGDKTYDTDSAELMARKTSGWYGDPHGFEEMLFRKEQKEFFLFGQGGGESVYPEATLVPLSVDDARSWLNQVVGPEAAQQICEPVVLWNEETRRQAASQDGDAAQLAASGVKPKTGTRKAARSDAGQTEAKPAGATRSPKSTTGRGARAAAGTMPKPGAGKTGKVGKTALEEASKAVFGESQTSGTETTGS